jgi:phosphoribosylaminoimidazole-succinocarboxamide synthase
MAIRVNDFMCGLFAAIGIRLVDFKLEFGRVWDDDYSRVILADEISPDGCRLWDMVRREARQGPLPPRSGRRSRSLSGSRAPLGLLPEGDTTVLDLDTHRKNRGK